MLRTLSILCFITLNACSSNYMSRGIPAPIESRDDTTATTSPRMGRVMPGPAPTQPAENGSAVRTYPGQINAPGIDDVTSPTAPPITDRSTTGQLPTQRSVNPAQPDLRPVVPPVVPAEPARPLPPALVQPQAPGSPASALLASVNTAIADGELERAAALAERALRISPRDGYLWYKLASIRYQQERFSDAAGFAQRALSFAGSDRTLSAASNTLLGMIEDAR